MSNRKKYSNPAISIFESNSFLLFPLYITFRFLELFLYLTIQAIPTNETASIAVLRHPVSKVWMCHVNTETLKLVLYINEPYIVHVSKQKNSSTVTP